MNIFLGNLSFASTEEDVKKLFEGFGNVASVVIVMRKEKKTPKSRGFGFVEMPDEQQALAAMAALNGKEFMGRLLNVNPTRPKTEAERKSELNKKMRPKVQVEQKKTLINPIFHKPGAYKGGRRTHSYMKRYGSAGTQEETRPRRSSQDNPMRWRKRGDQPKPRRRGESQPWEKPEGESKPWVKSEGGFKPRRKAPGEFKSWKKTEGKSKPWSKSSESPQKFRFKGRKKQGGYKR